MVQTYLIKMFITILQVSLNKFLHPKLRRNGLANGCRLYYLNQNIYKSKPYEVVTLYLSKIHVSFRDVYPEENNKVP